MALKIVIAGPKSSGKTTIGNFIAGHKDNLSADKYSPTIGVRILEIESGINGISQPVNIELWDASGDHTSVQYTYDNFNFFVCINLNELLIAIESYVMSHHG